MSFPALHPHPSARADDPEQLPDESEIDDPDDGGEPDEEPDGRPDPGFAEERARQV